jgi:hypothetical protein
MNCQEVRGLLPLHAYGDLAGEGKLNVEAHLAQCSDCRREIAAFEAIRAGLDAIPVATRGADIANVYRAEALRLRRRARRWRLAAALTAVAVVVLLAPRLEVRVDQRQLSIRWSAPEAAPIAEAPARNVDQPPSSSSTQLDERLRTMSELIQALAANIDASDRERQEQVASLKREFAAVQRQSQERLSEAERDVSALYAAHFGPRPKAVNP